jgi:hypothetical protein
MNIVCDMVNLEASMKALYQFLSKVALIMFVAVIPAWALFGFETAGVVSIAMLVIGSFAELIKPKQ